MKDFNTITSTLTSAYLQKISRHIIDCYKARKFSGLDHIYRQVYPAQNPDTRPASYKQLFLTLIKLFHPDSLNNHLQALKNALKKNLHTQWAFYQRFISIQISRYNKNISGESFTFDEDIAHEETYMYENAGIYQGEYDDGSTLSEDDAENDIISIISSIYLGNLSGLKFEPIDLAQIDAELILSDRDIHDLEGLQYCVNLIRLDLSNNNIDSIYEIQFLTLVEELDLSNNNLHTIDALADLTKLETVYLDNNMLEDISVLTTLENLAFVSIVGNPLTSMDTIAELHQRGVIVLYF